MPDTVLRLSPADIQRLSFECRSCGAVIAFAAEKHWKLRNVLREQTDCPGGCGHEWLSHDPNEQEGATDQVLLGLKYLVEHQTELRFVVRLEISKPEGTPAA